MSHLDKREKSLIKGGYPKQKLTRFITGMNQTYMMRLYFHSRNLTRQIMHFSPGIRELQVKSIKSRSYYNSYNLSRLFVFIVFREKLLKRLLSFQAQSRTSVAPLFEHSIHPVHLSNHRSGFANPNKEVNSENYGAIYNNLKQKWSAFKALNVMLHL